MATVEVLTAARALDLEANTVVSGYIDEAGHLILVKHDGSEIDAGLAAPATGGITIDQLPSRVPIDVSYTSGTGPARPTARTDIPVYWSGPAVPANAIDGDKYVSTV